MQASVSPCLESTCHRRDSSRHCLSKERPSIAFQCQSQACNVLFSRGRGIVVQHLISYAVVNILLLMIRTLHRSDDFFVSFGLLFLPFN